MKFQPYTFGLRKMFKRNNRNYVEMRHLFFSLRISFDIDKKVANQFTGILISKKNARLFSFLILLI